MMKPVLYLVIPCYNEEEVLPLTSTLFLNELNKMIREQLIDENSKILFVDDGSKDQTWELIEQLSKDDSHYIGVSLAHNRGHQNALTAGLLEAKQACDITISVDCDGQDDLSVMSQMVKEYLKGSQVVYGVRSDRSSDSPFKRFTAETFYKFLKAMDVETVFNHADYRLVSKEVLNQFADYHEVNLYLRGLFPLIGYPSSCVYYKRSKRLAGKSHYPLAKMFSLASDGLTSLSIKPISLISAFGFVLAFISFIVLVIVLIIEAINQAFIGWLLVLLVICFLAGIQIFAIGVVGIYVGKTYMEAKARPRYLIYRRTKTTSANH